MPGIADPDSAWLAALLEGQGGAQPLADPLSDEAWAQALAAYQPGAAAQVSPDPFLPEAPTDPGDALLAALAAEQGTAGSGPAARAPDQPAAQQDVIDVDEPYTPGTSNLPVLPPVRVPLPGTRSEQQSAAEIQQRAESAYGLGRTALEGQKAASSAEAAVDVREFEEGKRAQRQLARIEEQKAAVHRELAQGLGEIDKQIADAASREPDQGRWWANRSSFGQTLLGLAAFADGFNVRFRRGGTVAEFVAHQIDKDVAIQKARMDKELSALKQTRLGREQAAELEIQALGADYAARNARYQAVLSGLKGLRARATDARKRAEYDGMIAQLEMKRNEESRDAYNKAFEHRTSRMQLQMRREELDFERTKAAAPKPIPLEVQSVAEGLVVEEVGPDGKVVNTYPVSASIPGVFGDAAAKNRVNEAVGAARRITSNIEFIKDFVDLNWAKIPRTQDGAQLERAINGVASFLIATRPRMTDPDLEKSLAGAGMDLEKFKELMSTRTVEEKKVILDDAAAALKADTIQVVSDTPIHHIQARSGNTLRYSFEPGVMTDVKAKQVAREEKRKADALKVQEDEERKTYGGKTEAERLAEYPAWRSAMVEQKEIELGKTLSQEERNALVGLTPRDFLAIIAKEAASSRAAAERDPRKQSGLQR